MMSFIADTSLEASMRITFLSGCSIITARAFLCFTMMPTSNSERGAGDGHGGRVMASSRRRYGGKGDHCGFLAFPASRV